MIAEHISPEFNIYEQLSSDIIQFNAELFVFALNRTHTHLMLPDSNALKCTNKLRNERVHISFRTVTSLWNQISFVFVRITRNCRTRAVLLSNACSALLAQLFVWEVFVVDVHRWTILVEATELKCCDRRSSVRSFAKEMHGISRVSNEHSTAYWISFVHFLSSVLVLPFGHIHVCLPHFECEMFQFSSIRASKCPHDFQTNQL